MVVVGCVVVAGAAGAGMRCSSITGRALFSLQILHSCCSKHKPGANLSASNAPTSPGTHDDKHNTSTSDRPVVHAP